MNALKSFWVISFLTMVIGVGINVVLILGELDDMLDSVSIVVPEQEEIESSRFWSFRTREIEKLIEDLSSRQSEIDKRAQELAQIEAHVETEKKELKAAQLKLEQLQQDIEGSFIKIEKSEAQNLNELAVTYANMPPDAAIEVFKEMDDVFVVKILSLMEPEVLAPIFQAMLASSGNAEYSSKRVARLTELMRKRQE